MGPTVFTMPHLVNELFELAGKKPQDYFEYEKLDPSFHFFFEDGTRINWCSNLEKLAKEIEDKTGEPRHHIEKFARDVAEKFDITNEVFMENSLHVLSNYFKKPVLTGMFRLHRVGIISTMNRSNSMFFKDPRVIQLFNHFSLYVGSSPLIAPATLNLITHLLMNVGIYIPRHGMYSLVTGLVKLAEEIGVKFHYNKPVEEIVVADARVKGIMVNGEQLNYDRVISNMDVYYTYHRLLPHEPKPTRTLSQPKSSSVIGFFWGVNGIHPQLNVHNMLFAKDRNEEYRKVFTENTISNDPSTYISVTSKLNPGNAPAGKENWFVLATAPHMQGQDWPTLVDRTRQNLFMKIERMLGIPLRQKIEMENVLTPPQIEKDYSSAFGAIYGNSSNSRLAAFLRHPNYSPRIKGLFFAGGSVHPGAGIPMCLNSAKIMEKVFE
jgi:diapolycopene oxygenase